jgi:nitrogen-specific signal transduction histidine kinase
MSQHGQSVGNDEGLASAIERLRVIQDEIVRGIAHAMSNRVASLSAGLFMMGEHGTANAASVAALQSELDRMEQLLVQLRMLPRENVPVEPLLASESALTAVALHAHHGALRNVICVVDDDGKVPPARAEPNALLHALLVAITTAKQAMASGANGADPVRLMLRDANDVVRFIATSDADAGIDVDDSVFAIEAAAANWLVSNSGGRAFPIATGCVVEIPTLASTRRPR